MKHPKSYDSTPEIRKRMSKVRLKNGKAETILAKKIWHKGYRYRRNYKKLPGSPDVSILRYRVAVFVDGEFWHGENWEERKAKLKHNREYWIEKLKRIWQEISVLMLSSKNWAGSLYTFGRNKC